MLTAARAMAGNGRWRRQLAILLLGFASGLPLALTGQALQAWLTVEGLDFATIGFMGLVGIPYTFKFLWAPLMDRFEPPWLGRRRGWLVSSQLALAAALVLLSLLSPATTPQLFALMAVVIAFLSASQDVVFDAYRTDLLPGAERGLGASVSVFGYRLAMIVSGGLSLIWAEQWGDWPAVYRLMAGLMVAAAVITALLAPALRGVVAQVHHNSTGAELKAFVVTLAAIGGALITIELLLRLASFDSSAATPGTRLLVVLTQIAAALAAGLWTAKRAGFDTLNRSLTSFFSLPRAGTFLLLIILYKLGDAFAGTLTTPFLLKAMAFTQTEVGVVNKVIGLWVTIAGVVLGGTLMLWLGLVRSLLLFGVLQLLSNAGFWLLAELGRGALGSLLLPAFDWGFVSIAAPTPIDYLLLLVITVENLTGGMGTAAFVALLMALCQQQFSATHFALLSALASVGRIYVSPVSGVLAPAIGWPNFFLFSMVVALPGLVMIWWLRHAIGQLSVSRVAVED